MNLGTLSSTVRYYDWLSAFEDAAKRTFYLFRKLTRLLFFEKYQCLALKS